MGGRTARASRGSTTYIGNFNAFKFKLKKNEITFYEVQWDYGLAVLCDRRIEKFRAFFTLENISRKSELSLSGFSALKKYIDAWGFSYKVIIIKTLVPYAQSIVYG